MDENQEEEIRDTDGSHPDDFLNAKTNSFDLKIGMIANSEDEAYDMYNKYAYELGFSIRKDEKTYKRGTTELIRRSFVCSREGFREFTNPGEEKKYDRLDTRCGCRAQVVFKVDSGVYKISQLISEHNHVLIEPSQRHLLRSARKIHDTSKGVIKSMANAGIRATKTYAYLLNEAGGYKELGFTRTDCHNFIQVERSKRMAAGDGQSLINYFKKKQVQNPMFFYTVQVDEDNRMSNFFWRDGISKLDYECFGDVVIFDTTFRTNRYNMICAPFVGVNHHWKNVLFGCAFLCDETAPSFIWLFHAFLQSMDYKAPKTIFTDQDHAMAKAIAEVFPSTKHRLCQWHISKNAAANIPSLLHEFGFREMFNFLLYKCDNEIEFEEKWKEMIETWGCSNQSWLLKLYDIRSKWAPAFSRDIFSCNISSSQRSESTNNVFQQMACKTLALTEFVHHYEENAEKMREAEVNDDFKCVYGKPVVKSRGSGILKQARKEYTNKLFAMFEDEFLQTMSYSAVERMSDGAMHLYEIKREEGNKEYIVLFDSEKCTISCSCKLFESLGLLCRHALRVLNLNNVKIIPAQYILGRWTKVVKEGYITENYGKVAQDNNGDSAKTLCLNRLMRKAFTLMNLAATLDGTTEIAERYMDRMLEEVKKYRASLGGVDVGEDSNDLPISTSDYSVMDPLRLRQKGQTYGRMKGVLERKRKNSENAGRGKRQAIKAVARDIGIESNILQPSRFFAQSSNIPVVDSLSLNSNVTFTSMLQSTIYVPHLG